MEALLHRLVLVVACAVLVGGVSTTAHAQPAASIDSVQMPAWVERSGRRTPLLPGMELRAGDQIFTGAGSRAIVRLSEGSVVKLGENGTLRFSEINRSPELFRAALGVLQGAFRFTTELVGQKRKREVDIRVAQVTAGIRGTDLWGRGRKDNEVVCLIEGEIEVGVEGDLRYTLDKPLQFYRRVDAKTQPIGFIDQKQLGEWAKETELDPGKPSLRAGGRFSVLLASVADQRSALGLYDELRKAGYPAEILPRREGEQVSYIVRIRQLPSRAEAQALGEQLKGKFGITEPKVSG
jgi:hypothetical protein